MKLWVGLLHNIAMSSFARSTFRAFTGRETYVGADFQDFAVLHVYRAGFDAARFADVARAGAVDWNGAGVAGLAVVAGNSRSLTKRFSARIFVQLRPKDHVTARNFVSMEPPVLGLRHLDAEVIVVGVRGADEQRPCARKLVKKDAWFSRLVKKIHMLRYAQSPRVNVLPM